uniref:LEM domain-containing protein n=1 Tax=Strongyloides stercoralis TaxID=6248 RepID=A0A0K0EQV1_STRER
MANVSTLSKEDLRRELSGFGINTPITQTTRPILEKKLIKLRKESKSLPTSERNVSNLKASKSPTRNVYSNTRTSSSTINTTRNSLNNKTTLISPLIAREIGGKSALNALRNKSKSPSRTSANKDILKQLEILKEFSKTDPISIPKEISYSSQRQFNDSTFKSPRSFLFQDDKSSILADTYEPQKYSEHPSDGSLLYKGNSNNVQRLSRRLSNEYPGTEMKRSVNSFYEKNINLVDKKISIGNGFLKHIHWFLFFLLIVIIALNVNINVDREKDILITSFYNTFSFVFNYAVFPVFIIGLIAILLTATFLSVKYYRNKKLKEEKQTKETAEKIVGYLTSVNSSKSIGIPEYKLFDEMFPKMMRTKKDKRIFENALKYIFETEINIRYEIHDYDGVETKVYFWTAPLREKWQGSAIGSSNEDNFPRYGPTNCLKIRGMSYENVNGKDREIMEDIRLRCIPYKILHMQIVNDGKDAVLYIKLKDNYEAYKVFFLLHSNWFNGDLLNCKFIEEVKYDQRFKI